MSYDNWKQASPDSDNYIEDKECLFCGEKVMDGSGNYCSKNCADAYAHD